MLKAGYPSGRAFCSQASRLQTAPEDQSLALILNNFFCTNKSLGLISVFRVLKYPVGLEIHVHGSPLGVTVDTYAHFPENRVNPVLDKAEPGMNYEKRMHAVNFKTRFLH